MVFKLGNIYPNPSHQKARIQYSVASKKHGSLKIYDVTGRLVKTLVDKELAPGYYQTQWNAKRHASGVYFIRFVAGDYTTTKKLILFKK